MPPPWLLLLRLRCLEVALDGVARDREILEQRPALLVVHIQFDTDDLVEQHVAFVLDKILHVRAVGVEGVERVQVLPLRVPVALFFRRLADVDKDGEAVALPDLDGELLPPRFGEVLLDDHLSDGRSIVT